MSAGYEGYHDGSEIVIRSGANDPAFVANHETVHDVIFTETCFGWAQGLLRVFLEGQIKPEQQDYAIALLDKLFQVSGYAHEVTATYLGVRSLAIENAQEAIDSLHPSYKDYYKKGCQIVDRFAKSSYLQYLFGKAIFLAAFCNKNLDGLVEAINNRSLDFPESSFPDIQLKVIEDRLSGLPDNYFLKCLDRWSERTGYSSEQLNKESTWLSLERSKSIELDFIILRRSMAVIQRLFPSQLYYSTPTYKKFWSRLNEAVRHRFGVQMRSIFQGGVRLSPYFPDHIENSWMTSQWIEASDDNLPLVVAYASTNAEPGHTFGLVIDSVTQNVAWTCALPQGNPVFAASNTTMRFSLTFAQVLKDTPEVKLFVVLRGSPIKAWSDPTFIRRQTRGLEKSLAAVSRNWPKEPYIYIPGSFENWLGDCLRYGRDLTAIRIQVHGRQGLHFVRWKRTKQNVWWCKVLPTAAMNVLVHRWQTRGKSMIQNEPAHQDLARVFAHLAISQEEF